MFLKATKLISSEFGPYKLGGLPAGAYKEVSVTPELEKMYYNFTRKDAGPMGSKKAAGLKKSPALARKSAPAPLAMTDQELDALLIDNSSSVGGVKKTSNAGKSLDASSTPEAALLKKLNNQLRERKIKVEEH